MIGAMELQPDDGLRSSLGIGPGSDDVVGSRRSSLERFVEGIGKLTGNTPGDRRKKTGRLTVRMVETTGLAGLQVKEIDIFSDSQLIVGQVNGDYEAREATMTRYLSEVHRLISHFKHLSIVRVPQVENVQADMLAKLTSAWNLKRCPEMVEKLSCQTIPTQKLAVTEATPNWIEEILRYKKDETLPIDPTASLRLSRT
ncbi:hypothetical protein B296_00052662 [Ensete ventricosum]|uniref:RNase H type-1 domain-containing protein n=1 Tax=Ensete ventricosum TaxID=4639 RepID=A0A426YBG7_ENSVE|nr:hypothetical protein B296_00052662 [Ensete ventricosum]